MSKKQKKFHKTKKVVVVPVFPKPTARLKFPSISRVIPEIPTIRSVVLNKVFLVNFVCGFFAMAIGLFALQVKTHMGEVAALQEKKSAITRERFYWENVMTKYPAYRDGYFKLATIEYRLGDIEKSEEYIIKALEIDPHYTPALTFREQLQNY